MDTKDAPQPATSTDEELSVKDHQDALKRQDKLASGSGSSTSDEALPKVQSEQSD